MIDPREIPVAGAAVGVTADFIVNGGELLLVIAGFIVETLDLWLPFLGRLAILSDVFDWIPAGAIEQLLTWLTIVFVVVYAFRIGGRIHDSL